MHVGQYGSIMLGLQGGEKKNVLRKYIYCIYVICHTNFLLRHVNLYENIYPRILLCLEFGVIYR